MAVLLLGIVAGRVAPQFNQDGHHCLDIGDWMALATDVALDVAPHPDVLLDWAQRQNEILSAYIADNDVLPIALGSVFTDPDRLREFASREIDHWTQDLRGVRGKVEYALTIETDASTIASKSQIEKTDGASFLRHRKTERDARLSQARLRRQFVATLADFAQNACSGTRYIKRVRPGRMLDMALLVDRKNVGNLTKDLQHNAKTASDLGMKMCFVGPSPAFSFLERETADA